MAYPLTRTLNRLCLFTAIVVSCIGLNLPSAQAGVLLQGFYWDAPSDWNHSWWNTLSAQAQSLSQSGFTAVWIPPILKGATGGYSDGYDPFDDYDIGSKDQRGTVPTHWGTRTELTKAVAVMRSNGLQVYVDDVMAQRNGDAGDFQFRYKNAFGAPNGGRFEKTPDFFFNNSNGFGRALNHDAPSVLTGLIAAGDWMMRAIGVQGLRIDLAKDIPPNFLLQYLNSGYQNGTFTVTEYWDEDPAVLSDYVSNKMQGRVSAFDFPLWGRLKDMSNSKGAFDMHNLISAGLIARDPQHAVTFVENHDTDRSYPTLTNKHLGYAFILTSEGYPTVFWKDYFNYNMKPLIDPLIWIHEKLAGGGTVVRYVDHDNLIYERTGGRKLLVGINENPNSPFQTTVAAGLGSRVVLHDYTGHQPDVVTGDDGRVTLAIGANSYVAYSAAGFSEGNNLASYSVTQELDGADDLDLAPARMDGLHIAGLIYVKAGTPIDSKLVFQSNSWREGSRFNLQIQKVADAPNGPIQIIEDEHYTNLGAESHAAVTAPSDGWYTISVGVEGLSDPLSNAPYRLILTYQAPQT